MVRVDAAATVPPRPSGPSDRKDEAVQLELFRVTNRFLNSRSTGVRFRNSQDVADVDNISAPFDTTVLGIRRGEDWVEVNGRFLPIRLHGVEVLEWQPPVAGGGGLATGGTGGTGGMLSVELPRQTPPIDVGERAVAPQPHTAERAPSLPEEPRFFNVWTAIRRNDLDHLKECIEAQCAFLDSTFHGGITPLMLAASASRNDCCVLLLKAGSTETVKSATGLCAADMCKHATTKALLEALAGREFDVRALDEAIEGMSPEVRLIAEDMLDEVALRQKELREQNWEQEQAAQMRKAMEKAEEAAREKREAALRQEEMLREERAKLEAAQKAIEMLEASRAKEKEQEKNMPPQNVIVFEDTANVKAGFFEVALDSVPVYTEPSRRSGVICVLNCGEIIRLLDYDRSFRWRNTIVGGKSGWVEMVDSQKRDCLVPQDISGR